MLLAAIALTVVGLAVYGYTRKREKRTRNRIIGLCALCVLAGAFVAVLPVLDRNMLNGLDSHLAYFTVCLMLEGVSLLGLLILLPCAFLKRNRNAE